VIDTKDSNWMAARDYGYVFGKIMSKHPELDARLVNDIIKITLAAMLELSEEKDI